MTRRNQQPDLTNPCPKCAAKPGQKCTGAPDGREWDEAIHNQRRIGAGK